MRIDIHAETQKKQCYSCKRCGQGCRSFLVPVRAEEREAIEKLRDWRRELGIEDLWMRHKGAGASGYGLAKRADGACVFLDEENLCVIHKHYGLKAKPLACQLFPFVFTPFAGTLRVGLRFDCPGVCESDGEALTTYRKELSRLAQALIGDKAVDAPLPAMRPGASVSAKYLEEVNEAMLRMVGDEEMDLRGRLQWMRAFGEHLERIRWANVGDEDFAGLMAMLEGGLKAEVSRRDVRREAIGTKVRRLLGQVFYMLCQEPGADLHQRGFFAGFAERMERARAMKQVGGIAGVLPAIRRDWPQCQLTPLDESFGGWDGETQAFFESLCNVSIGRDELFWAEFLWVQSGRGTAESAAGGGDDWLGDANRGDESRAPVRDVGRCPCGSHDSRWESGLQRGAGNGPGTIAPAIFSGAFGGVIGLVL